MIVALWYAKHSTWFCMSMWSIEKRDQYWNSKKEFDEIWNLGSSSWGSELILFVWKKCISQTLHTQLDSHHILKPGRQCKTWNRHEMYREKKRKLVCRCVKIVLVCTSDWHCSAEQDFVFSKGEQVGFEKR